MPVADVLLPSLSETMDEGTIAAWLVEPGAEIAVGDPLVEIETDKATMVYASEVAGTVQTIGTEGDTYPVGTVIARVGDPAELGEAPVPAPEQPGAETVTTAAAAPAVNGDSASTSPPAAEATEAFPAPAGTDVPPAPYGPDGERVKASPLARRMAAAQGVALEALSGSGAQGRIVMVDVVRAAQTATPAAAAVAAPSVAQPGAVETSVLSRTEQLVASRMSAAKTGIPEFTVTTDVDMTEVVALRGRLKRFGDGDLPVPSLNDFVLKAAAAALVAHPRVNATFIDGELRRHSDVNVGFAVAAGDALVVPVIRNVDRLTLRATTAEARRLAVAVRDRTVTPGELEGGTFTVSNLGMFGVSDFTAIINVPQVAILAVGGLGYTPFEVDGEPQLRRSMRLTLTSDHRVIYGAHAAEFLRTLRNGLEHPELLLAG